MDRLKMLHALASPDLQGRGSERVRHGKTSYLLITAAMHEVFGCNVILELCMLQSVTPLMSS